MKQEALPREKWTTTDKASSALARLVDAFRVIARNRLALFGLFIVCTGILTAIFAPYLATHDPYEINIANRLKSPSLNHWLGTDFLGRDTYSRIVFGARTAFEIASGAVFLGAIIGIPLGAVAGFAGRWVDSTIMHLLDATMPFPGRSWPLRLLPPPAGALPLPSSPLALTPTLSKERIVPTTAPRKKKENTWRRLASAANPTSIS